MSGYYDDEPGYAEYLANQDEEAAWRASESAAAEAENEARIADEEAAATTEQDHPHVCPVCGDSWLHANDECDEPAATPLPMAWVRRAWAKCPRHEGTDE